MPQESVPWLGGAVDGFRTCERKQKIGMLKRPDHWFRGELLSPKPGSKRLAAYWP